MGNDICVPSKVTSLQSQSKTAEYQNNSNRLPFKQQPRYVSLEDQGIPRSWRQNTSYTIEQSSNFNAAQPSTAVQFSGDTAAWDNAVQLQV